MRADRVVPLLDALAEGAWIAVLGAGIDLGQTGRIGGWGPLPYAVAAGLSIAWTRRRRWPLPTVTFLGLLALAVGGGLAVAVVATAGTGGTGGPGISAAELLFHPAAWLVGLAVVRGTRHRVAGDDDLVLSGLLGWGTLALVVPWLVGASAPEAERTTFAATAFPATVLFVAAGLLGVGLARLEALSETAPVHWRQNRSWLWLLGGTVATVAGVSIPAALLLGQPIASLLGGTTTALTTLLAPLLALAGRLFVVLFAFLDPLVAFLRSLAQPREPVVAPPSGASLFGRDLASGEAAGSDSTLLAVVVIAVVAIIVVGLLAWLSRRRLAAPAPVIVEVAEEHHRRVPPIAFHLPRLRGAGHRRPGHPRTATDAYLAFLADLERSDDLARRPAEGPATHAARLRRAAPGLSPGAAFLAADYQLERYAGRALSSRETGRAIARWQRLRGLVRGPGRASRRTSRPGPA